MTDEVYAPCPACDEQIPFYHTVDVLRECPECGTPTGTPKSDDPEDGEKGLFKIATDEPIEPAPETPDPTVELATDGGDRDE